jgi:hypothetical protein
MENLAPPESRNWAKCMLGEIESNEMCVSGAEKKHHDGPTTPETRLPVETIIPPTTLGWVVPIQAGASFGNRLVTHS